jgi:2-polyprenyl-3-methyl-5-hydroxy-6-metoxy-1,4-benzoquinol methylase
MTGGGRAQPPCAVCGATTAPERIGAFDFAVCVACGYGSLEDAGEHDYWAGSEASPEEPGEYWTDAKRDYFAGALKLLAERAPGRRLLDLGGGVGFFAELALERGWDAYSLDVSPRATELAAARIGKERALTETGSEHAGTFDVVTLWCVVAHTRTPHEIAATAAQALRPGGLVWLTTPNFRFQRPYAQLLGSLGRRLDFRAHDHLGHFTDEATRRLLATAGFAEVEFHFRGVTETVIGAGNSRSAGLVALKRAYNHVAFAAGRALPIPAWTSELQVTGRLSAV